MTKFRFASFFISLIALASPICALAQFQGDVVLTPKGCEATGQCTLQNALRFKDAAGVVWEAKAGLVTDGASIPGIFQPLVGSPFEPAFVKAAIVHDHYCDRHVRPWRETHKVFYEGLVAQGVPIAKAKTMYFAVVLGGPKWIELIPGKNCGKNCVNNIKTGSGKPGLLTRKADYSAKDIAPALSALAAELEANPESVTLDQIEQRARALRPTDFYLVNGHQYKVDNPDTFQ